MTPFSPADVTVRDVPDTRVAVMTHRGDPARLGQTLQRFIAWRRAAGLRPSVSATYNVFRCDPRTTPPDDFRLDLCAATDRPVAADGAGVAAGVEAGVIPGGRCAVLRVVGASDDLEPAALFLYRDWLPRAARSRATSRSTAGA
jgi:AraC family transcriptional regulator